MLNATNIIQYYFLSCLYKSIIFLIFTNITASHFPLFSLYFPSYIYSYDLFIRGQEICSGAQRCHEPVSTYVRYLGSWVQIPYKLTILHENYSFYIFI